MIVAAGGMLGVLVGAAAVHSIGSMPLFGAMFEDARDKGNIEFQISVTSILVSTGVLFAVGLIAGMIPAIKAARLDPIEALQVRIGRRREAGLRQRVAPLQATESRKVGIGGTELGAVLDGQGRQMGVGCEVAAGAQRLEQFADKLQVARTGMHDGRGRLVQPGSHQIKSCIDR